MKQIKVLTVSFNTRIENHEIPAFRGAIVDKVGRDSILFHNHLAGDAFLYKYPLIQYKTIQGKPTIVCIDYGVDEIHKFFENRDWSLKISDRWLDMKIDSLNMNQFTMQVWDKQWRYSILNWIALNQENHEKYLAIESLTERISFLERTLIGNIISMAKGISWDVDKPIKLSISEIKNSKPVSLKGKRVMGFTLDFTTNVFLPNYIGLGKSVSLGYGVVRNKKNDQ